MTDPATLSKQQLLDLVAGQAKEIARDKDIIRQLEEAIKQKDKDYLKLWRERFEARSERYIGGVALTTNVALYCSCQALLWVPLALPVRFS